MRIQKCLIAFFVLLTISTKAQTNDTTKSLRIRPLIASNTSSQYPLIIINQRRFKNSTLSNLYFDVSKISIVRVISPKNDSSKLYGKDGHNGIIIINTKRNTDWISSQQIYKQHSKLLFNSRKRTIIKINGDLIDPTNKIYIQKDLIKSITVNNKH